MPPVDQQVSHPKNVSKISAFVANSMQAKYCFHLQSELPIQSYGKLNQHLRGKKMLHETQRKKEAATR